MSVVLPQRTAAALRMPAQTGRRTRSIRGLSASNQRGMSLIEVLISVLIFSFGLLGLLALQARATQFSASAEDTSRAALLANELGAQMWAARSVNLPAATITAWQTRVASPEADGLPDGTGSVTITGSVAEITVSWRPPRAASIAENRNRYTTQVMVQ